MDPDAAVLDRWRAGDQVARRELFARYFDQLYRFFANKCEEPGELIQATFFAITSPNNPASARARAMPRAIGATSPAAATLIIPVPRGQLRP